MKTEKGVMIMKDGKAWGKTYEDGHSASYGWMDAESAPIHDPKYCTKPTDVTWEGSHYTKELEAGKIVHVERTTTVRILEENAKGMAAGALAERDEARRIAERLDEFRRIVLGACDDAPNPDPLPWENPSANAKCPSNTAMIGENLDQREGQPEPNSVGLTGGGAVLDATPYYAFDVASVQWEHEDNLPEMEDVDYDHLFEKSEVRDGVRMFPYISTYSNEDGTETRHFLGA